MQLRAQATPRLVFDGEAGVANVEIRNDSGERLLALGEVGASGVVAQVEGAEGVPIPLKLGVALLKDKDGRIDLDAAVDRALEVLYVAQEGGEPLDSVRGRHTTTDSEGKSSFDGAGFYAEVRAALLAAQQVSPEELKVLASERAAAVVGALTRDGTIDESRVAVLPTMETKPKERGGELVTSRLSLTAD